MKLILSCYKLKCLKSEKRLNEIVNGVLTLAIYQFDPNTKIQSNLLTGRLISQYSHDGIHSQVVACTTTDAKGLHAIKNHGICAAEGQDIRVPITGATIEFKRTVQLY